MKTVFISLLALTTFYFSVSTQPAAVRQFIKDTTIITDNGYQKTYTEYKDGKKNGTEISIRANGDTSVINQYKDDKFDGRCVAFYFGNKIGYIVNFKNNVKFGESLSFDTLGNIESKTIIEKGDAPLGVRWSGKEVFFKMNKPIFTQIWINGRRANIIVHDTALYQRYRENDISLGNKIFRENCAVCHLPQKDFVGPSILEAIKTRNQEWLIKFIRNADVLYKAGDNITKTVYKKYNNLKHPDYTYLTKSDVIAILKFIKEKK